MGGQQDGSETAAIPDNLSFILKRLSLRHNFIPKRLVRNSQGDQPGSTLKT